MKRIEIRWSEGMFGRSDLGIELLRNSIIFLDFKSTFPKV